MQMAAQASGKINSVYSGDLSSTLTSTWMGWCRRGRLGGVCKEQAVGDRARLGWIFARTALAALVGPSDLPRWRLSTRPKDACLKAGLGGGQPALFRVFRPKRSPAGELLFEGEW